MVEDHPTVLPIFREISVATIAVSICNILGVSFIVYFLSALVIFILVLEVLQNFGLLEKLVTGKLLMSKISTMHRQINSRKMITANNGVVLESKDTNQQTPTAKTGKIYEMYRKVSSKKKDSLVFETDKQMTKS